MKFRKKPIEIEAVRVEAVDYNPQLLSVGKNPFDGIPFNDLPDWLIKALNDGTVKPHEDSRHYDYAIWHIKTLEDGPNSQVEHIAIPGDWIIKGIDGELYPCKPDIFEKTYEIVD